MKGPDVTTESVASVFGFLGNGIRLEILESLYERTVEAGPMTRSATYSAIREDVGVSDSGRFSYHLDKLTDRFVTKTDAGYRLREPGREMVKLRRTGILTERPVVDRRPVDAECYRCESGLRAAYDHGHVLVLCPDCPGLFAHDLVPDGTLSAIAYPPSGVAAVDIETAFERAYVRVDHRLSMMDDGFCPRCGGNVTATVDPCRDHATSDGSICDACGLTHPALATLSCDTCGQPRVTHPLHAAADRKPVADLLAERDVAVGWERFAELMRWPTTIRDEEVVFDAPSGDRVAVAIGAGIELR